MPFRATALIFSLLCGGVFSKDIPLNEESLNEIFDGSRSGSKLPGAVASGDAPTKGSSLGLLKSGEFPRYDPRDRVVPGSTHGPAVPASGAGLVTMPGSSLRWNVADLIRLVLPQIEKGSGAMPFSDVIRAMGFAKFLEDDVVENIHGRGGIAINSGRVSNTGAAVSVSVALALPVFNTAHLKIAESVSGDIAANKEGGFTISNIEGLSCGVKMMGSARISEISFTPDVVRISRRFGFDIVIDLNKAQ